MLKVAQHVRGKLRSSSWNGSESSLIEKKKKIPQPTKEMWLLQKNHRNWHVLTDPVRIHYTLLSSSSMSKLTGCIKLNHVTSDASMAEKESSAFGKCEVDAYSQTRGLE